MERTAVVKLSHQDILLQYHNVRKRSVEVCEPLEVEDFVAYRQSG